MTSSRHVLAIILIAALLLWTVGCEPAATTERTLIERPAGVDPHTGRPIHEAEHLRRGTVGHDVYEGGQPDRTVIEHDIGPGGVRGPQSRASPGETLIDPAAVESADQQFIKQAMADGLLVVQSAQIALQREVDPATHRLARRLMEQHRRINDQVHAQAARLAAQLPRAMPPEHLRRLNHLRDLEDAEFVTHLHHLQAEAHRQLIARYNEYSRTGEDANLRAFAHRLLPALQDLLELIEQQPPDQPDIVDLSDHEEVQR